MAIVLLLTAGCAGEGDAIGEFAVEVERYHLDNGLEVLLHVDPSDPVVAVAMTFHVGSAREEEGRTGFAHLFEHLFFLDSENLGPGGLDRLMSRIGSSTNGSTSRDRTNYFEVVPRDGLEKALWAEADKLGWFINTVTEDVLAKEKQVVKNEKRQSYDNVPYGHLSYIRDRALYPEGHPYRWQVIGSLADLDAAELADVKEFHSRWYGPGNATLVVAGDFDPEVTRGWIERYFGEVPARDPPERTTPLPEVALPEERRFYHEDNFARLPRIQLAWPAVPFTHSDRQPLQVLARVLSEGKGTPLHDLIVDEEGLAPAVTATLSTGELGGSFLVTVTAHEGIDLDRVLDAVDRGLLRFEEEGVPETKLRRIRATSEAGFYGGLSNVLGKAIRLADYALLAGDPDFLGEDLARTLAVTDADVLRVHEEYLKGKPRVVVGFVPRGRVDLAPSGAERGEVVEEPIVFGAEEEVRVTDRDEIPRTPSRIDRSVEPPFGEPPRLSTPAIHRETLGNGLSILAIEDRELPLVQFELRVPGGRLAEEPSRGGAATLLAETMLAGTEHRTPEELEEALDLLGASLQITAGPEHLILRGTSLARSWPETLALTREVLLHPRFDPVEFERARDRLRSRLAREASDPVAIAENVFRDRIYGDHPLGRNPVGTEAEIAALGVEDLRAHHARAIRPEGAVLLVAGAVAPEASGEALAGIEEGWRGSAPPLPDPPVWDPERAGLHFVDVPNAGQSVLRIGRLALSQRDADFWPASILNFRLGGGGFASELLLQLREARGYTYGISSSFAGSALPGPFRIGTSVRANVTTEAARLIREILEGYGPDFDEEDLEITRGFLLRANAGAHETLARKVGLLGMIHEFDFPDDILLRREEVVRRFTVEEARALADRYLDPEEMAWVVVGDARTQRAPLEGLGLGSSAPQDPAGR